MHSRFDQIFKISLILKCIDGVSELIGGVFLFFVPAGALERFVDHITNSEIKEDPHDFLAGLLRHSVHNLSKSTTTYAALYLAIHGFVKLVALTAVLKNKYWGYPLLILVLSIFLIYQCVELSTHLSLGLILLSAFDAVIIVMTSLEWKKQIRLHHLAHENNEDIKNSN